MLLRLSLRAFAHILSSVVFIFLSVTGLFSIQSCFKQMEKKQIGSESWQPSFGGVGSHHKTVFLFEKQHLPD